MGSSEFFMRGVYTGIVACSAVVIALASIAWKMFMGRINGMQETIDDHEDMCAQFAAMAVRQEYFEGILESNIQTREKIAALEVEIKATRDSTHRRLDELIGRLDAKGMI